MNKQIEEMVEIMGNWALQNNMCWNEKHAKSLADALHKNGVRKIPCATGLDYIDGYKLGFKEGVEAVRIQLETLRNAGKLRIFQNGKHVCPELMVISIKKFDEICKELEGEK